MRLLRVYIDGYRNLKNVTVEFDKDSLTTVVIGENGSGKSNLIEAIVEVFRAWDLNEHASLAFTYDIKYLIRGESVRIFGDRSHFSFVYKDLDIEANRLVFDFKGTANPQRNFIEPWLLPDLVFGYYSGSGRRLEALFDKHQTRYYNVINKERPRIEYQIARDNRRLFYCRPNHGALALLAYLAKPRGDDGPGELLTDRLGITGFHSALALMKQPSWFRESEAAAFREAGNLWGSHGPAGDCSRALRNAAFHPLELQGAGIDDYRRAAKTEAQLACFLRDSLTLGTFAANYKTDQEVFAALEAVDISDLFRELIVWVTRTNDASGDISFSDLSDGERQLLMVLGLIRVSRGKEALFLLDEPDTHLNPAWQLTYLELIREWTEVATESEEDKCQIIMTSHNPLTIAALTKNEVRVMTAEANGDVSVKEPYADPRGMGFTSTLTEIFGLPTTLDAKTQKQIDDRNALARIEQRSEKQERLLIEMNDKLNRLGFMHENRDPLYDDFLKAVHDFKFADKPPMTPDQVEKRRLAMKILIKSLSTPQETAH